MTVRLTDFEVLTFDCYGTLIDWETGILAALGPLVVLAGEGPSRDQILEDYAAEESAQEAETPGLLYRDILTEVHKRLERRWGIDAPPSMAEAFGRSVPQWPAFPDSAETLKYLKKFYKLVILSNIDNESFAGSNKHLEVTFDAIYSAEIIGSYKPDLRNFEYLVEGIQRDFGLPKGKILHVAQSLYHDHVPARRMGLANAWIDRRHGEVGGGATPIPENPPKLDFHFHSMADLAAAHQAIS